MNTSSYFLGYETSAVMDRVCLPSSAVLSQGLATVATTMTSAVQTTSFANLVTDTQNVIIYLYKELAVVIMWDRYDCSDIIDLYVLA